MARTAVVATSWEFRGRRCRCVTSGNPYAVHFDAAFDSSDTERNSVAFFFVHLGHLQRGGRCCSPCFISLGILDDAIVGVPELEKAEPNCDDLARVSLGRCEDEPGDHTMAQPRT